MRHSPLPFRHSGVRFADITSNTKVIARCIAETVHPATQALAHDNAAFIVKACNAHDELVTALLELQKQLRAHIKFDVKKHYSLMVADAAAGTALAKVQS